MASKSKKSKPPTSLRMQLAAHADTLPPDLRQQLAQSLTANPDAATAFFWVRDVVAAAAPEVARQITDTLSILSSVNGLAMDIPITLKPQPHATKKASHRSV